MIDDAEDGAGREWGVLIEEVLPGGRADEVGLHAGDVLVALNGAPLGTPRGSREDPVEAIARLLDELECGDTVALDYVRNGEQGRVEFTIPDVHRR